MLKFKDDYGFTHKTPKLLKLQFEKLGSVEQLEIETGMKFKQCNIDEIQTIQEGRLTKEEERAIREGRFRYPSPPPWYNTPFPDELERPKSPSVVLTTSSDDGDKTPTNFKTIPESMKYREKKKFDENVD